MRDPILALLAKEPAHGYEVRQRLVHALGPLGEALNPGQVYVTLGRLAQAGLVRTDDGGPPGRKVYELTTAGRDRVAAWLTERTWTKVAPTEFHLKLVAAATTGLADPVALIEGQRLELLRQLRDVRELVMAEPTGDDTGLVLEGAALRLQADVRWLEVCEQHWIERGPA